MYGTALFWRWSIFDHFQFSTWKVLGLLWCSGYLEKNKFSFCEKSLRSCGANSLRYSSTSFSRYFGSAMTCLKSFHSFPFKIEMTFRLPVMLWIDLYTKVLCTSSNWQLLFINVQFQILFLTFKKFMFRFGRKEHSMYFG